MIDTSKNMKWEWMLYFTISASLSFGAASAGWIYFGHQLTQTQLWIGFGAVLLLIGLSVGYLAAHRFQRRMDLLHFGIIQLAKGNLSHRFHVSGTDSFDMIYRDFNEMKTSLEERIKLLQKLGEENVLLQTQSNEAAVLEERRRLARDLHDTVSQQLFAIHMSASSLPKIIDADLEKAKAVMEQLIQMSYLAQKQMRGLIAQLRPIELEGKSLQDALNKWFPDYCRQNGLQGSLNVQLTESISEAKEHQLFLIVQEGMANIVKHASARNVTMSLQESGHQYVLHLTDDGEGFDPLVMKTGSYGLSTMKERAQKLGGDIEILTKTGAGTRIKAHIPKFSE